MHATPTHDRIDLSVVSYSDSYGQKTLRTDFFNAYVDMPGLTQNERERAVGMLLAGTSKRNVSRIFRCSWNTVSSLWNRYQQTGSTSDQPRSGRPRVTTRAEDNHIRLRHLRDRCHTATSTANTLFRSRITAQTVRNRLRSVNLRPRRPYRGPVLRRNNRDLLLHWTRAYLRWNQRQWNNVIFSDECRFIIC